LAALTTETRAAVASIDASEADIVVMLSPHGSATGVYERVWGSLDGFGVSGISTGAPTDGAISRRIARAWGRSLLTGEADHGVLVPLLLMGLQAPVIACTLAEVTGPGAAAVSEAVAAALQFADALSKVVGEGNVLFVASANTSAALSARAPLTHRKEGEELDQAILACLTEDPLGVTEIPEPLWTEGGACGAGPLTAFGTLFAGRHATVRSYQHPFGVGYVVATATEPAHLEAECLTVPAAQT
jgi:hypothetical protein